MREPHIETIKLPGDVWDALEVEADRARLSLSRLVELLVRSYLPDLVHAALRERLSDVTEPVGR
jgi:hypothetical protein